MAEIQAKQHGDTNPHSGCTYPSPSSSSSSSSSSPLPRICAIIIVLIIIVIVLTYVNLYDRGIACPLTSTTVTRSFAASLYWQSHPYSHPHSLSCSSSSEYDSDSDKSCDDLQSVDEHEFDVVSYNDEHAQAYTKACQLLEQQEQQLEQQQVQEHLDIIARASQQSTWQVSSNQDQVVRIMLPQCS